ncbi:MAG: protein-tyrosine-phosphatase [Cytophagales bacterium]|nr:protein-tyrosine-phosphatase [Bernardetiaceae bacterium]MDW8203540.1 protein-tyrosine-phosphatase [Cytophagales bacterium]
MQTILLSLLIALTMITSTFAQPLLPALQEYCKTIEAEFNQIDEERKKNLQQIADYIQAKIDAHQNIRLTFICTHNSRRSQFGQVWAKVAGVYYGIALETFSGGTEVTACNPRTIAALQRAGFQIVENGSISSTNPIYALSFVQGHPPLQLFSKAYYDATNPQQDFAAILVCSQADEACPIVRGATARIYHGYEDPKKSDGTPQESTAYDATCRLIAREMFYVFALLKK